MQSWRRLAGAIGWSTMDDKDDESEEEEIDDKLAESDGDSK